MGVRGYLQAGDGVAPALLQGKLVMLLDHAGNGIQPDHRLEAQRGLVQPLLVTGPVAVMGIR